MMLGISEPAAKPINVTVAESSIIEILSAGAMDMTQLAASLPGMQSVASQVTALALGGHIARQLDGTYIRKL
jgi:hypothetical protein